MARNGDITVELVHEFHDKNAVSVSGSLVTDCGNLAPGRDPLAMVGIFRAVLRQSCETFEVGGECPYVGMLP